MRRQHAELVQRARAGDKDAFADLVRHYRDAVFGLAYHRVGDFAVAEDLTQDAFVRAYLRLGELREAAKFAPWLLAIARNLCNHHLRSRRPADEPPAECSPAAHPSADGVESHAATRDLVHRALSSLPPQNGLALSLYYVNGYSYAEIAGMLDVPASTVRGRLQRGRRQLKEEMTAMMREEFEEHKPGEELTGVVIQRLAAEELWGRDAADQVKRLGPRFLLIDGELAELCFLGDHGSTRLEAQAGFRGDQDRPLQVLHSLMEPGRYFIFGTGRVQPDGPRLKNQAIQTRLEATLVPTGAARVEPFQPSSVSCAEVWAMSNAERNDFFRSVLGKPGGILLDGAPAHVHLQSQGGPGGGTFSDGCEVSLFNRVRDGLHVLHTQYPRSRYLVFGEAEVTPPGIMVKDAAVELQAAVEEPIADAADGAPGADAMLSLSLRELFGLTGEEQYERLSSDLVRLDGEVARVCLRAAPPGGYGTGLAAYAAISTVGDEPMGLYRLAGVPNRYYVFGAAVIEPGGLRVRDQIVDTAVVVNALSAEEAAATPGSFPSVSSAEVCRMPGPQRDAFFRELRPNVRIVLDGGLAEASLLNGDPGGSVGTPGGEVRFRNLGPHNLHVYRWTWPRARYYVFGDAEVTPPGLRVRDATVLLEGRLGSIA